MLALVLGTERRIVASSGDPLGGTDGMRLRHSDACSATLVPSTVIVSGAFRRSLVVGSGATGLSLHPANIAAARTAARSLEPMRSIISCRCASRIRARAHRRYANRTPVRGARRPRGTRYDTDNRR